MNFSTLIRKVHSFSSQDFVEASQNLENFLFSISKNDVFNLISDIGIIPESIPHDSSEEKLFSKVSDILLSRIFHELGLSSSVMKQRADCADVVAKSRIYDYSLVGDAKAFRLSRTAKNQKDFKVQSMADWRGDHDYSVLVCPYYQYPKSKSVIYSQALNNNVLLLSWEHLSLLLKHEVTESSSRNLSVLWKMSEAITRETTVKDQKQCFLKKQNDLFRVWTGIQKNEFDLFFEQVRKHTSARGGEELRYWEGEMKRIENLSHREAILELTAALKIPNKMTAIESYLSSLNRREISS